MFFKREIGEHKNSQGKFSDAKTPLYSAKNDLPESSPPRRIKKILVVDLDGCAITNRVAPSPIGNTRPDMISPTLIQHVESQPVAYDAFYACTHRHTKLTFEATFAALKIWSAGNPNLNPANITTTMVIKNLEKALGIPCLAVSTPDDFCLTVPTDNPLIQCGYGFENIMKPYEQKLMTHNKKLIWDKKYEGYETIPLEKSACERSYRVDDNSKNNQLILISQHAFMTFPECDIGLYFRDDREQICGNALTISNRDLSDNITLYITQDRPFLGIVKEVGFIKGMRSSELEEQMAAQRFIM
jgi:hypothetical protein